MNSNKPSSNSWSVTKLMGCSQATILSWPGLNHRVGVEYSGLKEKKLVSHPQLLGEQTPTMFTENK